MKIGKAGASAAASTVVAAALLTAFLAPAVSSPPAPVAAGGKAAAKAAAKAVGPVGEPALVAPELFAVPEGWEITVWAKAPMFRKPTNIDFDAKGRLWVCEGWRYRSKAGREPAGDRIMVLEDTDGDGTADKSWPFHQDPNFFAPLGIGVIGNKIVVSQPPDLIVFTDVNDDGKFDPAVDKREVLLTGFGGRNHDHSLHALVAGPDGRWYFNTGNAGEHVVKDRDGKITQSGSHYENKDKTVAGKPSHDGHVYVGGMALRVNPDGSGLQCIGHNFRNSYELCVASTGDVFQNDNDDTGSCRTSWLMEYGNAGFCSPDGKRSWQADIRRGQTTPVAHWRQEDPGVMPHGDIYGAGAPTGICFVEGDELGKDFRGTLLSCETALNRIFSYKPALKGAGYPLQRTVWLTTNTEGKFAGTDSTGGAKTGSGGGINIRFRPADVTVAPDGSIFIADWCDLRTGGHQTLDDAGSGTIYRLAPKGFKPKKITYDFATVPGLITALKSPAVNVRGHALALLAAKGAEALPAAKALLADENPFYRARAVWLLSLLGPDGIKEVEALFKSPDEGTRLVAYRALRARGVNVLANAAAAAADASPALRREAALTVRDVPFKDCKDILLKIAEGYDGQDRWYLEAFGTGCSGKEEAVWTAAFDKFGGPAESWDARFAGITWRLHPPQALPHLKVRIRDAKLPYAERRRMMTALAFITNKFAANAMADLALELGDKGDEKELRDDATQWVKNRHGGAWRSYDVLSRLPKAAGGAGKAADPAPLSKDGKPLPKAAEILALTGDPAKGKELFYNKASCHTCHKAGDAKGGIVGPELAQAGRRFGREVLLDSMLAPSAAIALGYEASIIRTADERVLNGIIVAEGDPLVLRDAKGETVTIDAKDVAERKKSELSLMPELTNLNLSAQELADVLAFLTSLK